MIVVVVDETHANTFVDERRAGRQLEKWVERLIISCDYEVNVALMLTKMIPQDAARFINFQSQPIVQFTEREGRVNVSDDNDIATLIKVTQNVFNFNLALDL